MIEYTPPEIKRQFHAVRFKNKLDEYLNIGTPWIRAHKDSPQTPTDLLPHLSIRKRAVLVRALLQPLQHILPFSLESFHELLCSGVLSCDAVGNCRGNAVDFLEHLDEGIRRVGACFNLTRFHAEGGIECHPLKTAS